MNFFSQSYLLNGSIERIVQGICVFLKDRTLLRKYIFADGILWSTAC